MRILYFRSYDISRTIITFFVCAIIFYLDGVFRSYTELPISVVDIVFLILSVFLVYFLKYFRSSFRREIIDIYCDDIPSFSFLIGIFLFMVLLFLSGIFISWIGIQDPFKFHSGFKSSYSHGYTLIYMGILSAIYALWGGLIFLFKLIRYRHRTRK